MIRYQIWRVGQSGRLMFEGVGFTFDPISDSAAFDLLEKLSDLLKKGEFDNYLTVLEIHGELFVTGFSKDSDVKFALRAREFGEMQLGWPLFVTKAEVICAVFCDKYEFELRASYLSSKGNPIRTTSGFVGLKDFHLALLKRIEFIEKIKATKVGRRALGKLGEE